MVVSRSWLAIPLRSGGFVVLAVLLLWAAAVHAATVIPPGPNRDVVCKLEELRKICRTNTTVASKRNCLLSRSKGPCAITNVEMHEEAVPDSPPVSAASDCSSTSLAKCRGKAANRACCTEIETTIKDEKYGIGCVAKMLNITEADSHKMMTCCYCSDHWCDSCGNYLGLGDVEGGAYAY